MYPYVGGASVAVNRRSLSIHPQIADRNVSGTADEMPFNGAVAETLVLFDGIGAG